MYQQEFDIVQLKLAQLIDKYQLDDLRTYPAWDVWGVVVEVSKSFAVGDRITANHQESRHVEKTVWIPATPWDWSKKLITDWQPSLNFGWLKPNLRAVETQVSVKIDETIYNVYPVEGQRDRSRQRIVFGSLSHPTPLQWLSSEPPTAQQVIQAEIEVLDATESARYMAYNRLFESPNASFNGR